MKISIITVVYNRCDTIRHCIESVLAQNYEDIEYIVIDGASIDGTKAIISEFQNHIDVFISEPDKGIYDAINKGIMCASGDVVGILNSDDFFPHNGVIRSIANTFLSSGADAVFGDVNFVAKNDLKLVKRKYSSRFFSPRLFRLGFMPAHPTFYAKRESYIQYGLYKTNYKIAADYELLVRFLYCQQLKYKYIPEVLVNMRLGGVSTQGLKSFKILNREIRQACLENCLYTNYAMLAVRIPFKLCEFLGALMRNIVAA